MPWWRSSSFSRHSLESPSRKKDCFWSSSDPTSSTDSMSVYPNTGGHRRSFLHLQWRHKYIPHSTEPDVVIPRTRLSSSEPSPETTPLSQSPRSLEQTLVRGSCCIPQPLPLPESAAPSSKREMQYGVIHNGNSGDHHLPTPRETSCRSADIDKDKGEISNGDMTGTGRRSQLEAQTQNRVVRPRSDVKFEEDGNPTEKAKHRFRLSVPVKSAPTSPISSPMLSPRWMGPREMFPSQYSPPQGFQVWSAPEFLSLGRENSPLPSPRSANVSCQNPSTETRENNALVKNVHPLPLPPRAAALPPSTPKASNSMTSQWQKGKLIGRGTFGTVFMATNRETGALCAMKEVEILHDDVKSAESIKQLQQEIKVLSKLKHPNIVQYYGSEIVEDKFYIYLEYVYPGSINKYVREHCGAVTESVVRNFTRHILSGLAYLHSTKTVHRDIKGANLLVDATGVVKLADFGTAKHLNGENAFLSLKGSPYWMAPELMHAVIQKDNNPDFAFAIDVWSLGCTIIEMLEGKPPWSEYEGAAALFKVMRESPSVPESLSREGKDFLHCCFKRNPGERPSAVKLLEHPFLKNSHGHKLMTRARSHKERLSPSVRNGRSPSPHNSNAAAATPDVSLMRNRKATYKSSGFSHYLSPLWLMRHHETKLPS